MNSIASIRKEYKLQSFLESDAATNPFVQFSKWWDEAIESNIEEVNAMTLATVDENAKPSARIVLLKAMKSNGFEFYTNYESHKAQQMQVNNKVALVFFWKELERQIRIEGTVAKTTATVSDEYFMSRPQESKIGAWSSPQSSVIASRKILEENVEENKKIFENKEVTRPIFWGGYIVTPTLFEFWQGRSSRLHDRIEYEENGAVWTKKRLAP